MLIYRRIDEDLGSGVDIKTGFLALRRLFRDVYCLKNFFWKKENPHHSVEPRLQGLMGNESLSLSFPSPRLERVHTAVLHPAPRRQSAWQLEPRHLVVARDDALDVSLEVAEETKPPDARKRVNLRVLLQTLRERTNIHDFIYLSQFMCTYCYFYLLLITDTDLFIYYFFICLLI